MSCWILKIVTKKLVRKQYKLLLYVILTHCTITCSKPSILPVFHPTAISKLGPFQPFKSYNLFKLTTKKV